MKIQVRNVMMFIVAASLVIPVGASAKEKAAPKVDCYQQASALGFTGSGGKRDRYALGKAKHRHQNGGCYREKNGRNQEAVPKNGGRISIFHRAGDENHYEGDHKT